MGGGAWGRGGSDVAMAARSMTAGRRKHLALFAMALPLLSWHEIKSKFRTERGLEMIRCCRLGRCDASRHRQMARSRLRESASRQQGLYGSRREQAKGSSV